MNMRRAACLLGVLFVSLAGCQQPAPDTSNKNAPEESAAPSESTAADVTARPVASDVPAAAQIPDESAPPMEPDTATEDAPHAAADAARINEEETALTDVAEPEEQVMDLALDEEAEPSLPLLEIGSKAPELKVAGWVQGDEVAGFPHDQVTVVEFWATWCPPCKASMPHLSQLQQQYADRVVFIGVSDESTQTVHDFLNSNWNDDQTWKEVVKYRIAVDDSEATSTAYLAAARAPGIPTAFVVGHEGIVEWIGHPMSIDEPLEKIVAGTWDRDYELTMQRDLKQLQDAMQSQPDEAVLAMIEEMVDKYPESLDLQFVRFRFLMKLQRWDEGRQLMEQFAAKNPDKTQLIHAMTWISTTSDDPTILETAQQLAEELNEQAGQQDADILDTLARIHFRRGHLEEAIRLQEQAVEANGAPDPRLRKSLDEYKKALESQQEQT